jgi:uncharacterized protein YbjT (DUF2867 family)
MRLFITGASGFIGTAVVAEMLAAGHDVIGLARSRESADRLTAQGADVLEGSLDDLSSLHTAAAEGDPSRIPSRRPVRAGNQRRP